MDAVEIIRKALRDERKRRGLGVLAFERALGFPDGGLKAIIRDKDPQIPSLEKAQQAAKALGLELYIGPIRSTDPSASSTIAGAIQSPEVREFETAVDDDGYVGLKLHGNEWTGELLIPPDLSKALALKLAHRAMEIEEQEK